MSLPDSFPRRNLYARHWQYSGNSDHQQSSQPVLLQFWPEYRIDPAGSAGQRNIAQILAEPTITTLSGQKASFLAGGEFPFPVVQGSSGGLTSITIQFRPYGVKLDFTPIVNEDGTVQLKVAPEVSALDYTNAVTISGLHGSCHLHPPGRHPGRAARWTEFRHLRTAGSSHHRHFQQDAGHRRRADSGPAVPLKKCEPLDRGADGDRDPQHRRSAERCDYRPHQPKLPVPMLDPAQFDKKIGKQKPATQPQPGTGGPQ